MVMWRVDTQPASRRNRRVEAGPGGASQRREGFPDRRHCGSARTEVGKRFQDTGRVARPDGTAKKARRLLPSRADQSLDTEESGLGGKAEPMPRSANGQRPAQHFASWASLPHRPQFESGLAQSRAFVGILGFPFAGSHRKTRILAAQSRFIDHSPCFRSFCLYPPLPTDGLWLSLVERFVRDEEVPGSNPGSPTTRSPGRIHRKPCFSNNRAVRTRSEPNVRH